MDGEPEKNKEKSAGAKLRRGLVLGKFYPPHRGHQYLVDFARHYVDHLTVIVGTLARENIPGALRHAWMKESFPSCEVLHLTDENPQEPHEDPNFWAIWHNSIRRLLPEGPDYVFASESYGARLAEVLEAQYVPVDHGRELVPISGSDMRKDVYANWSYLMPAARPYFAKRVCIFGPESTGKSTLARNLARHFDTVHVHEYARPMLSLQGDEVFAEDIPRIARGHRAAEEAMALQANRVLFCDTDLITTAIWAEKLFGSCPDWIQEEAERRRYDLYLLCNVDTPWVDDPQRFLPEEREQFFARCRTALERYERPYLLISGSWEERFDKAVEAVEKLFGRS